MNAISTGLDGIIVGETAISHVDGDAGTLIYRGQSIDELAGQPFESVAALVLGDAVAQSDLRALMTQLSDASSAERRAAAQLPEALHPMSVLQALCHQLDRHPAAEAFGEAGHGLTLAARLPGLLLERLSGKAPAGDNAIERILSQLDRQDAAAREALNTVQILQLEHGFNAGTFASRVVASTLAPIENAISAGLGALHGVLHGGADQAALEAADQVGESAQAAAWVDDSLASGKKIMGMGHREYRVVDPRSHHVKRIAERLVDGTPHQQTFETLLAIEARCSERMAERGKAVHANLEFYKGIVYRALGLPTQYFTATFAFARMIGYVAHFLEHRPKNRLIRPASRYVGPSA